MKKILAVVVYAMLSCAALAQGCGNINPNCIVPTRPLGDNGNAAASTGFIAQGVVITPAANSLTQALNITQSAAGTSLSSNFLLNSINITSDVVNAGSLFGVGLNVVYSYGGGAMEGGREAIQGTAQLNATPNASSGNYNFVGVQGVSTSIVNSNGTGLTVSTSLGSVFGGGFISGLLTGATNFNNATGAEFNTFVQTGASVAAKSLIQISADPRDRVQGAIVDTMFWAYNQSSSSPGWNTGFLIDNNSNSLVGAWPIKSTGTIFKTGGSGTVAHGFDISNTTCTSDCFKSNGFVVDGSGIATAFAVLATNDGIRTQATTVGALPGCVAGLAGLRMFVTDHNATPVYHATAAGGGANNVAVVCDGTNWYLD